MIRQLRLAGKTKKLEAVWGHHEHAVEEAFCEALPNLSLRQEPIQASKASLELKADFCGSSL
jgi:hypothetical protein